MNKHFLGWIRFPSKALNSYELTFFFLKIDKKEKKKKSTRIKEYKIRSPLTAIQANVHKEVRSNGCKRSRLCQKTSV